ncbi:MAG: carbohydrate binding family 9 domain-containing protein [Acidobacteria bacterium]|nr:carbohydrate binding family 9 domain-containing protein [Acidobacteriota bacterium]
MSRLRLLCPLLVVLLGLPATARASQEPHVHPAPQAQSPAPGPASPVAPTTTGGRRRVTASRTDGSIKLDGILDEDAWQQAVPATGFVQQEPSPGQPATDRTEVRVLYDKGNLYIGFKATSAVPVVATEMRRDADRLFDEDNFQVILDTFHDSRNGYMFVTTPLGARLEQQIFDEGEGGGRGATSTINRNWDGVWDSAAKITDEGWTAELLIPFTTVRFRPADEQVWGINLLRHTRRKNEITYWSPIPRAYSLTRVSLAGELDGLRNLSRGLDLRLKPFTVGGGRIISTAPSVNTTSVVRDIGLDARYGLTAGLNLDLTVNTDFAQVEVDDQQVNLTRFSLFFPEKRDFFLENSNFFTMGTGPSFTTTQVQTDLFFSRRIGLSPTGQAVPIIGGARLAGKAGRNNIGVLNIQTDSAFGRPGDNFFVSRYSRDILRRSRVGAVFINKDQSGTGYFNRTMGVDANFALGRSLQVSSYLAKTETPGKVGNDMAMYGRIAYRDPKWNLYVNYLDVQENFNAEAGFVQRTGVRTTKAYVSQTPRPKRGPVKFFEPMYVFTYMTDQTNRMVYRQGHYMLGTTLRDDSFINVIFQQVVDVLDAPFRIRPDVTIPTGEYRMNEVILTYNTSPGKRLYERLTVSPVQFYGGTRLNMSAAAGVRLSSQLSTEVQYNRNDVKMPWGNFVVNLASARVDYTFSPRMTLRSLTQYNTSTSEVSTNIRFNFIYRPGSDLYLVYTDQIQTGLPADIFGRKDRQLVMKLTYLLQK